MAIDWENLPDWLVKQVSPLGKGGYKNWLERKAAAHVKRDKKRYIKNVTYSAYKQAIHDAVIESNGKDAYTGEILNWSLISKYNNDESKKQGRKYKHKFAALPTVDHVDECLNGPNFVISSWRTNDAKHDLALDEFLTLCRTVLEYHGYSVQLSESLGQRPEIE